MDEAPAAARGLRARIAWEPFGKASSSAGYITVDGHRAVVPQGDGYRGSAIATPTRGPGALRTAPPLRRWHVDRGEGRAGVGGDEPPHAAGDRAGPFGGEGDCRRGGGGGAGRSPRVAGSAPHSRGPESVSPCR